MKVPRAASGLEQSMQGRDVSPHNEIRQENRVLVIEVFRGQSKEFKFYSD